MSGFNFGQIGEILSKYMDTDYVDIKRDISGSLQEIYSNIPCHASFKNTDNPNPETVDIKPIIQSIEVHLSNWVDVQNNDYLVVKKMSNDNQVLETYSGRCGNPVVEQSRKKVLMTMSSSGSDIPTPPPPTNPVNIIISFISDGVEIKKSITEQIERGVEFRKVAPVIENYNPVDVVIDGESKGITIAIINEAINDKYQVQFIYESAIKANGYRFLVNGLYTTDEGALASGYHLFKKIDAEIIDVQEDVYTVISKDVKLYHPDMGKLLFVENGIKLVLVPDRIFTIVIDKTIREDGNIEFKCQSYIPTEEEIEAYTTGWYD